MAPRENLGDLEELVLLSVLRLRKEAHGGSIREDLRDEAGREVSVSTVYVTLMRLEEKGFLHSWKGEPTSSRGGKAKRFFQIRPEGLAAVQATRRIREHMWQGVPADV